MPRSPRVALLSMILLGGAAPAPCLAADDEGWRPLFDGTALDREAWTQVGGGGFSLVDGSLRTDPSPDGLGVLLYTKETLGDCQIRVVYRSEDARDNAGVHVRVADDLEKLKAPSDPDAETGAWFAVHHGYEVQICDFPDPLHRTGAIYSLAPATSSPEKAPEEWKTMVITLDGDLVTVDVDGVRLSEFDPKAEDLPPRTEWYEPKREPVRPRAGYIGLQVHDPGDVVFFKEVSIRPLPTSPE
ncbi:3-keto-disaccharide hydrolase [Tautonia plasticadhaerens]|uniref:3-keto-alpha-glucoside-1,2-lyase/3-keto-2-hydroxy-glucal hydratase domain-containing protein n=1 Tax=Tautonia plasticadhaerens TaxID=2527974 RepID=A0A518HCS9_9BACT|nr:DUF1080 domain-containing protein [Tautonia plasticadhaerens]QDV38657.1 hypothetical protein ElP_66120 [Tautonia plasticadhaerens]